MYNEIYLPIDEKHKILEVNERSIFQLIEQYAETDKGAPKTYKCTKKFHATMFEKKFIPLYLKHLHFLIKRAGWLVTKIYFK